MRLALYSDVHVETFEKSFWNPPKLDVDVVILAGDIGTGNQGIEWGAATFKDRQVLYVAGNHEYYGLDMDATGQMRRRAGQLGVSFLEKTAIVVGGVRFLGCTLWCNFELRGRDFVAASQEASKKVLQDFSHIKANCVRALEPQDLVYFYRDAVHWLEAALAKPFDGKTVVITHFGAHPDCVSPRHADSPVSPYFVNDLRYLQEKYPIALWCSGHTHTSHDFLAAQGCRMISNQRGYPKEVERNRTEFREHLVIEV